MREKVTGETACHGCAEQYGLGVQEKARCGYSEELRDHFAHNNRRLTGNFLGPSDSDQ